MRVGDGRGQLYDRCKYVTGEMTRDLWPWRDLVASRLCFLLLGINLLYINGFACVVSILLGSTLFVYLSPSFLGFGFYGTWPTFQILIKI